MYMTSMNEWKSKQSLHEFSDQNIGTAFHRHVLILTQPWQPKRKKIHSFSALSIRSIESHTTETDIINNTASEAFTDPNVSYNYFPALSNPNISTASTHYTFWSNTEIVSMSVTRQSIKLSPDNGSFTSVVSNKRVVIWTKTTSAPSTTLQTMTVPGRHH